MNIINSNKIIFFISCAAILSFAGYASASESGIIKNTYGHVMIERGSSNFDAKVGDPVQEKDRISVIGYGSAGISMKDETLLSIGPNSSIVINTYAYNSVTREGQSATSVLKGSCRFVTGLIGRINPKAVKVTTQSTTIGIRGTEFIVEVPDAE